MIMVEIPHLFPGKMVQITKRKVFPSTKIHLTESWISVQFQALGYIYGTSSQTCTGQIAGIASVYADIRKAFFQAFHLFMATGCQHRIILTMDSAEYIPLRFSMADQIDFSHKVLTKW